MSNTNIKPFLKWAGGKRWLTTYHSHYLQVQFENYIEPFLGSGAVYFHLRPPSAILGDSNLALIETYKALRSNWRSVVSHLEHHQKQHSDPHYYETRNKKYRTQAERAAQFIYLNRTCWNGLFRVNLKGEFNVPIGTRDNIISPNEDFSQVSKLLKKATISCDDFESLIDIADSNDFLFVDPPYTVKHDHNGFVRYNEKIFSWNDQVRLHAALGRAHKRGAKILLTNANHKSIQSLYRNHFSIEAVTRQSAIASKVSARKNCNELVIHNITYSKPTRRATL